MHGGRTRTWKLLENEGKKIDYTKRFESISKSINEESMARTKMIWRQMPRSEHQTKTDTQKLWKEFMEDDSISENELEQVLSKQQLKIDRALVFQ